MEFCSGIEYLYLIVMGLYRAKLNGTLTWTANILEQEGKIAGRVFRPLVDLLFRPLERDHCRVSFESELRGAHLPDYYRTKG